jgi:hypothetical protein
MTLFRTSRDCDAHTQTSIQTKKIVIILCVVVAKEEEKKETENGF